MELAEAISHHLGLHLELDAHDIVSHRVNEICRVAAKIIRGLPTRVPEPDDLGRV